MATGGSSEHLYVLVHQNKIVAFSVSVFKHDAGMLFTEDAKLTPLLPPLAMPCFVSMLLFQYLLALAVLFVYYILFIHLPGLCLCYHANATRICRFLSVYVFLVFDFSGENGDDGRSERPARTEK